MLRNLLLVLSVIGNCCRWSFWHRDIRQIDKEVAGLAVDWNVWQRA